MCMTEQSELAYKAMDETAEWGATHLRNVAPMRRVHELEPHVMPDQSAKPIHVLMAFFLWRAKDFVKFWSNVEWFNVLTGFGIYVSAIVCIVGGMFMLSAACGHADVVEYVFAVIGRAL